MKLSLHWKKLITLLGGLSFSVASFAISPQETYRVYDTLIKSNGLQGKAPPLTLKVSKEINAYANVYTKQIVVFSGLRKAFDKDEVALVLGHELTHYVERHAGSTWRNEFRADQGGARLMTHAGYNLCRGKEIFKAFHKMSPYGSKTHPAPLMRWAALPC